MKPISKLQRIPSGCFIFPWLSIMFTVSTIPTVYDMVAVGLYMYGVLLYFLAEPIAAGLTRLGTYIKRRITP